MALAATVDYYLLPRADNGSPLRRRETNLHIADLGEGLIVRSYRRPRRGGTVNRGERRPWHPPLQKLGRQAAGPGASKLESSCNVNQESEA